MSQRINNLKVNLTKESTGNMMEEHPLPDRKLLARFFLQLKELI